MKEVKVSDVKQIFILLSFILVFIGGVYRGSFAIEFNTKEACEFVIRDMKKDLSFTDTMKCYPKGDVK